LEVYYSEGSSDLRMVAGLQILSSGFLGKIFNLRRSQIPLKSLDTQIPFLYIQSSTEQVLASSFNIETGKDPGRSRYFPIRQRLRQTDIEVPERSAQLKRKVLYRLLLTGCA
jgi:hypothetical protein